MSLRAAVVGGGTVSAVHLDGLRSNPRTELQAICDVDEATANDIAAEYDIEAFYDVDELLERVALDWLHICTPVQTHLSLAKKAIEAGVPVQIEKPITETYEEFEELAAVAERHDAIVSEKHNHAFDPVVRSALERVNDGRVGELRGVDVIYTGSSRPDDPNRGPWNFELDGGEFEEGLPHPLYLALRAGGYPRNHAALSGQTALFGEYEEAFTYDGAQVQYVTDDEVLCNATVIGGTRPVRQLLLHGEDLSLTADLISQTLIEHDRDYKASATARALNNVDQILDRAAGTIANVRAVLQRRRNPDWETLRLTNAHYYQNDLESKAIAAGDADRMPVPLEESRWTMRLMEEIRDAARATSPDGAVPSVQPTNESR